MDEPAIELRPIGRKGLTSLRVVSAALIFESMFFLLAFALVCVASMAGRLDSGLAVLLGVPLLAATGVLAWAAGVASEEIAGYQPGWRLER